MQKICSNTISLIITSIYVRQYKRAVLFMGFVFITLSLFAQQPQIARVNSAGTTTIYTDLKVAMTAAQDDDFIYLPGGSFILDSLSFKKRVHLIGTGHYPDSLAATGKTIITTTCYIFNGGNNGSAQGIEINGIVQAVEEGNFTFSKSRLGTISIPALPGIGGGTYNFIDCLLTNWVNAFSVGNSITANFTRCICLAELGTCRNSVYKNCIFLYKITNGYLGWEMYNNQFSNNIFYATGLAVPAFGGSGNQFFNNHVIIPGVFGGFGGSSTELNTTNEFDLAATFINVPDNNFNYPFDYHVKPTSIAYTSGNDGTQKGIYGSNSPYNPNPYNPHIYFKNIAATTNAQGQLQIEVKVKAQ